MTNVSDAAAARAAATGPAEGIGLFRTELCFLDREDEPSIEEQTDAYSGVLAPFGDRHAVVRTFDGGSDKQVRFVPPDQTSNPALGMRGLRLSLDDPSVLEHQLTAVAAASRRTGTETWVLAPMVTTAAEAAAFAARARAHGLKAGVMVEVPSAALLAGRLAEEVDFMSIGSNDLTQYTMAADRTATALAHLNDAWQPAVLRLVATAADAGRRAGTPVGVCGEAAADPMLAPVLVGLGVTSLSMAPTAIRPVGAQLAAATIDVCRQAAEAALSAADPMAARLAVHDTLRA